MKKWLVFDVGCIECGENSQPVGVYASKAAARRAVKRYVTNEPNKYGFSWGRPEWAGQHLVDVYEVEVK